MIRRFYVHNFRCLENFELPIAGLQSALLIGKNGSGKTAVGLALEILQSIARGTNRVGDLVKPKDFSRGRLDVPMRFEIEVVLGPKVYAYTIAFELPKGGKELRVLEEKLEVDGETVYARQGAEVHLVMRHIPSTGLRLAVDGKFPIDQSLVALPIIQTPFKDDALVVFKQWLAHIVVLRPMPGLILGDDSTEETLEPNPRVTNFGRWFLGVLAQTPAAYSKIEEYLTQIMPDFRDIVRPAQLGDLIVRFSNEQGSMAIHFEDLSDGEKCFMICALVLAANDAYGPLFCFWDEPDNYLALDEVGHFVLALRRGFHSGGQFIATSHNPEAIRRFSDENTLVLQRRSHLEPTVVRRLSELQVSGDLVGAMIRGDLGA